jgi:hypothetical protein
VSEGTSGGPKPLYSAEFGWIRAKFMNDVVPTRFRGKVHTEFIPNSYRIHTEFTPNVYWIEHECFNNNKSITTLKYNIHCLFNWLQGAPAAATGLKLKYVESECRNSDMWAVSCAGESSVLRALETGMRRVAVCGVEGVRWARGARVTERLVKLELEECTKSHHWQLVKLKECVYRPDTF